MVTRLRHCSVGEPLLKLGVNSFNDNVMRYESKQQAINRGAEQIYGALSKFSNFTSILADKVDSWEADDDTCSFMAKGFRVSLAVIERHEFSFIKIGQGAGGAPFPFTFWIQLNEVGPYDTRLRIVADVELNMMMKMVIGGKLQDAVDGIAEQIAKAVNV